MQWPPSDPKLAREASALLADLERTARVTDTSSRAMMNICNMLGRVLSIGLQVVPEEIFEFVAATEKLIHALPQTCSAWILLDGIFHPKDEWTQSRITLLQQLHWMARWYGLGCPALTLESNLAASLIATETNEELLSHIEPPWDCFIVRLPRDLIQLTHLKMTHLVVSQYSMYNDMSWWPHGAPERWLKDTNRTLDFIHRQFGILWGLGGASEEEISWWRSDAILVLLGKEKREYLFDQTTDTTETAEDRLVQAFARLVMGICCISENPNTLRRKSTKKQQHQRWRFSKLPLTTEYVLAPDVPVKFDCTEAVGAFFRGERKGPPRFQWIVRGHWRNQVHGAGRIGRKRIWIQPYWKGPEHAPMRMREYRFEGKKEG